MEADAIKKKLRRSQFAVVLVLAPLNKTFERKCLVLPFAPDALKLGRQTTARTMATSDNGFFDSRVLSRQHAEIWAERETGRVWLKDCKSSNGTYINKTRLSAENTESEPHELKRNDELDLGIDIISNDESKQIYHRISARVEKVSMLPLHVGGQQNKRQSAKPQQSRGNTVSSPNESAPSLSRSVSLETLRSVVPPQPLHNRNSEAIFGGSLENMALSYATTTAGGLMVQDSIKSHVEFELAAKRLVSQIRAVKTDTAKIKSIASLLLDIKQTAIDAENRDKLERERFEAERRELMKVDQQRRDKLKSSSVAALKAENARLRAELTTILGPKGTKPRDLSVSNNTHHRNSISVQPPTKTSEVTHFPHASPSASLISHSSYPSGDQDSIPAAESPRSPPSFPSSNGNGTPGQGKLLKSHKPQNSLDSPTKKSIQHNIMVLIGTTCLFTVVGVLIMFFFNPPIAPTNQSPLFSNFYAGSSRKENA